VGHPFNAGECATRLEVEQIVIIGGALSWESQRHLAELVTRPDRRVEAWVSPTFYDLLTTSTEMTHVGHVPLLFLHPTRLRGWGAGVKGMVDWSVALALVVLLTPAWLYWTLKARRLGVRPLERQRVLSASGAFELMGLNRALVDSPVLARLPALVNVLRRDMSLVGPRPIEPRELRSHERWWTSLATMRPGLTGLWRVNTGEMSVEERVALDLYYIRNYSLSLDFQILYFTLRGLTRIRRSARALARWHPEEETPLEATAPRPAPVIVSDPRVPAVITSGPELGRSP
jgi:lipopolysaccharide/colanic/teichoic acid biosynthesis glycosyltransferase